DCTSSRPTGDRSQTRSSTVIADSCSLNRPQISLPTTSFCCSLRMSFASKWVERRGTAPYVALRRTGPTVSWPIGSRGSRRHLIEWKTLSRAAEHAAKLRQRIPAGLLGIHRETRHFVRDAVLMGAGNGATILGMIGQVALISHVLGLSAYGTFAVKIAFVALVSRFMDLNAEQMAIVFGT